MSLQECLLLLSEWRIWSLLSVVVVVFVVTIIINSNAEKVKFLIEFFFSKFAVHFNFIVGIKKVVSLYFVGFFDKSFWRSIAQTNNRFFFCFLNGFVILLLSKCRGRNSIICTKLEMQIISSSKKREITWI